jgi:hypothetical protein
MHDDDVADLLSEFDRRLEAAVAEATKAREQADQALTLLNALREDVGRTRRKIVCATETVDHVSRPKPPTK